MVFQFRISEVLVELAQHAMIFKPHHIRAYTESEPLDMSALTLAKDSGGVYLLSPCKSKKAPEEAQMFTTLNGDRTNVHVCAIGHDPKKDTDWWVPGDDFALDLEGIPPLICVPRHFGKILTVKLGEVFSYSVHDSN